MTEAEKNVELSVDDGAKKRHVQGLELIDSVFGNEQESQSIVSKVTDILGTVESSNLTGKIDAGEEDEFLDFEEPIDENMLPYHLQDEINLGSDLQEDGDGDFILAEDQFHTQTSNMIHDQNLMGDNRRSSEPHDEPVETMGEDDLFDDFKEVEIKISTDGLIRGENDLGTQEKLPEVQENTPNLNSMESGKHPHLIYDESLKMSISLSQQNDEDDEEGGGDIKKESFGDAEDYDEEEINLRTQEDVFEEFEEASDLFVSHQTSEIQQSEEDKMISPGPAQHFQSTELSHELNSEIVSSGLKLDEENEDEDMFEDFVEPEPQSMPATTETLQKFPEHFQTEEPEERGNLFDDFVEPEEPKTHSNSHHEKNHTSATIVGLNEMSNANIFDEASNLLGSMLSDLRPEIESSDKLHQEV